ncbi:CocE/NonD family hydrolase [Gluconacetobacter tumulisoli]|uniref:CocE/NonD family hydrolase n=1 Tax=Gluconacetobacter tumulisoli TaxID=1286189 RepID=A0A7W4K8L2_9PROT|nr:CocE/NonD family hydrolase [Gluconacetobacter tumulisoli]MBB2202356.1 CocE/NonD family hydrolase [Gluconacetobacter tumulisoli]
MSVHIENHLWITLADGCRLGARLWLPAGAGDTPVPAILEYIPYRKGDGTRVRDEPMHGYFAAQGYACVRVDMRGSGESDGHLADEYLKQEQDDALEVIAWIAAQPWCSGAVGMMGKSWGGFNCLQVAARRPPALKAIMTVYSTDNRFTDDIHYMGGCLLNDNLWWGSLMLAFQGRPPFPEIAGPDWRAQWLERIAAMPFFPALWLAHQRYDAYWKHGSVCEAYDDIACPVLVVGGWIDSYTNAVPRLLERLTVPRRGIIGPWGHVYPHDGAPGPAIGFLQEAVRWWDQWLKGQDTGILDEPMLRAYVTDAYPPDGTRTFIPGRWVAEAHWPSPDITPRTLHLRADHGLGASDGGDAVLSIRSPQSHGRAGGEWMGTGCPGEMPTDQRLDDGGALVFETDVLDTAFDILGAPRLHVRAASDAPVAHAVVTLSDVAPDGQATRISYQVLNLTHRNGHETPEPLVPGAWFDLTVTLNDCGHRFAPGHRLRIAIGTAYWPLIWPAPHAATLALRDGRLVLPVRSGAETAQGAAPAFPPPAHGPLTPVTQLDPGRIERYSVQDCVTGTMRYVTDAEGGVFGEGIYRLDGVDTLVSHNLRRDLTIRDDDPLSARYVLTQTYEMGRAGWMTKIVTRTEMTSDAGYFHLSGQLEAFENDQPVARRDWSEHIARDLM